MRCRDVMKPFKAIKKTRIRRVVATTLFDFFFTKESVACPRKSAGKVAHAKTNIDSMDCKGFACKTACKKAPYKNPHGNIAVMIPTETSCDNGEAREMVSIHLNGMNWKPNFVGRYKFKVTKEK